MRAVGTCPVKTTTGMESMYAVAMPVTVLVAPGPEVTRTTPGLPEALAYPSAMCTAPCSWRTSIWLRGSSKSTSYMGRTAPPGKPKMVSTPSFRRHSMNILAPVIFSTSAFIFFLTGISMSFNPIISRPPRCTPR